MDEVTPEKIEAVMRDVLKVEKTGIIENMLQKKEMEFDFDNVRYKVAQPTFDQKQEANKERVKKYMELLKDPTFLMEEDLIKLYAARGINVKQLDIDTQALEKKREDIMVQLGEAIKNDKPDSDLLVFKTEIEALNTELQTLAMKKIMYLESSVESQVMIHTYTYFGFLCTMKKDGENWVRAFNSMEEYKSIPSDLMNLIVFYTSFMVRNEIKL